jgi:hypothetical protein
VGIPLRLDPRHDPARDGDGVAAGGVAHHCDCVLQMLKRHVVSYVSKFP